MKTRKLVFTVMAMVVMVAHVTQAADLTWDANGTGSGLTDGAGTWLNANQWWTGTTNVSWNNGAPDNATIGNGGAGGTIALGTVNAGTVTFGSFTGTYTLTGGTLTQSGGVSIGAGSAAITISSALSGSGGITKAGTGTLTLTSATDNYGKGGGVDQFTGITTISNGKIQLLDVGSSLKTAVGLQKSVYDTTGSTGAIGLNITGVNGGTGSAKVYLGGLAGSVDLATAVTGYSTLGALFLSPQTGTSASYGGIIADGVAGMTLTKNGLGTQTLTNANTFTGATMINGGTLALSGALGSALTSAFTVRAGTLELDNSGGTWISRLGDATALSLGSFTLKSYNGAVAQTETVGATTFANGGKVTIINGTTGGDQTTLAMGTVTRSAGAAIDFVGVNGTLGGGANSPNVTSTGSFPGVTNGIVPWATVGGTQWAITNANGIVAYSGGFVDPTTYASTATSNAQFTGSGTMGSPKSFNSLNVIASSAGQSLSLGGILTLTSPGAILKSGSDSYSITSAVANAITAGTELITHVDGGALTISAPLNTAIVNLAKGGTGNLILSGTRAVTFTTVGIAGGTLEFQGLNTTISAIRGAGSLIANLNSGQTLNITSPNDASANPIGPILIKGGMLANGNGYNSQGFNLTSYGGFPNIEINGGTLGVPYHFGRYLGTASDQIQITGGTSGFSGRGGAPTFTLNGSAGYEVVWGSAYFQPTTLVLNDVQADSLFNFQNGIDLNGSTRTVAVNSPTQAATISGVIRNSSSTAGLTKIGVGELALSGANTYNGVVTVSTGMLSVATMANGGAASGLGTSPSDAANVLLANGTTLKYTGAGHSSDRSFTMNCTAPGDSLTLDASGSGALNLTSTATPAYGILGQTRTLTLTGSSTGANTLAATLTDNGTGEFSVRKTGAGKWVLTGASSYTGPTTVIAGLLGVGAANNLGSGGNLVIEGGGLSISGTTLNSYAELGHTIMFGPHHTTFTLDIADAGNTFTVDQSLPSGGLLLSGAGTAVFQSSVSNLVLNVPTGATPTYGGVIANGAADMMVTKIGAGTQILTGNNTYTGATVLNEGELRIGNGSTNGKISGTAGLVFNGGSLLLNRTSNANIDAIKDAATITVNGGGTFSVTSASGGSSANENIGDVTVNSGAMNFVQTANNQNTLTLASLSRGPNADAAVTFSSPAFTTAAFKVNGASATAANEIIGPWVTVGTAAGIQTDYAVYDASSLFVARNITASAQSTWATAHALTNNYTLTLAAGTATQLAATRGINSLRNTAGTAQNITSIAANVLTVTGSSYANGDVVVTGGTVPTGLAKETVYYVVNASGTTFQLAATPGGAAIAGLTHVASSPLTGGIRLSSGNNLETYGILNGSATYLGIGGATGAGVLTTPTGGGKLHLTTGSGSIVINAPITDNGGAVTVVRNGTGGRLYLAGNNTFTGGLVVNGGVSGSAVQLSGTQSFTGGITLNGGGIGENSANSTPYTLAATLNGNAITVNAPSHLLVEGTLGTTSTITINPNAVLKLGPGNSTLTVQGVVSGSGVLDVNANNMNSNYSVFLTHTANTFSGDVTYNASNGANTLSVSSIGDGGKVVVGMYANTGAKTFELNSAASAALTFNTRQFELVGPSGGHNLVIDNNSAQAFTINTDLLATGIGTRTLTLQGTGAGLSTFAGKLSDGPAMGVSLTKAESGTWILSGTNTYTGTTIVSAGKLILSNAWSVASGILDVRSGGAKVQLDYAGIRPVAEFWTNGVKAASGIMYNSVNAPNHILGSGSIMVGVETFKVTYNGNGNTGGVVPVDSNAYINNQTVVVLGPGTLTKGDSSFGGWSIPAGPMYAPGSTFQITTNTTLYAIWRPAGTLIQFK